MATCSGCGLRQYAAARFRIPRFAQEMHPCTHVPSVVIERTSAHEIAIDDGWLVDEDAAADFEVELALGDSGHAPSVHAIGARRYFDPMADAGDRLVGGKEVARYSNEVRVVAD